MTSTSFSNNKPA